MEVRTVSVCCMLDVQRSGVVHRMVNLVQHANEPVAVSQVAHFFHAGGHSAQLRCICADCLPVNEMLAFATLTSILQASRHHFGTVLNVPSQTHITAVMRRQGGTAR